MVVQDIGAKTSAIENVILISSCFISKRKYSQFIFQRETFLTVQSIYFLHYKVCNETLRLLGIANLAEYENNSHNVQTKAGPSL